MLCLPNGAMSKVIISEWPAMVIQISVCCSTHESNRPFTSFMTRGVHPFILNPCSCTNLGCMKLPMAPESTVAVILMESASVIRVVRSLTSWYGVMAETMTVFCGTILVGTGGEFQISTSVGVTGSVG